MLESIPGKVFVVGVTLLIITIAYSSQYFIFISFLQEASYSIPWVLGPLNIFVLLIFYNYYLASTTDPGKVPINWEPPLSILNQNNTTEGASPPRFCKSCQCYKPPRTHHCRYCGRCVLKMDHHCPWINNCVGIKNYPHFLRFIFYVDIACLYVLVLLIWRVRYIMDAIRHFRFDAEPTTTEVIFIVINFVLDIIVLFSVGILSGYHFYCLLVNQSTIEAWERSKVETLIRRGKIPPFEYPFSVGIYRNICSVLGNNPLLWLIPSRQVEGDGITFALQPHINPLSVYHWPPRDPDDLRPSIFSSKYKRLQEKRQMQQLQGIPPSSTYQDDNVDDSEDYYDSGSFMTESEDDYSISDEELNMRDTTYNDQETYRRRFDHHPHPSTTSIPSQYPLHHRQQQHYQYTQQQQNYYPSHDVENTDEEDTIPLTAFIPRSSPSSSKETKGD
ncbi:DHHC palmitoyltransferase-domain-containing protein [Cunninghamella echinulata]|nr:DHHC palmitoyltransferase-domain-containing protein [Cunninghamella echinulata]